MTPPALRGIDDQTVREALLVSRGDLFMAAQALECKAHQLDTYIRKSEDLQRFVGDIFTVRQDENYTKLSAQQFADKLEELSRAYRLEALDVIHDLAIMDFGESAAMAEVKLKAAIQLRGKESDTPINQDRAAVLSELNTIYQQSAPRIKSIRAVQIEYQEEQ